MYQVSPCTTVTRKLFSGGQEWLRMRLCESISKKFLGEHASGPPRYAGAKGPTLTSTLPPPPPPPLFLSSYPSAEINESTEVPNARRCAVCREKKRMHTFPSGVPETLHSCCSAWANE